MCEEEKFICLFVCVLLVDVIANDKTGGMQPKSEKHFFKSAALGSRVDLEVEMLSN